MRRQSPSRHARHGNGGQLSVSVRNSAFFLLGQPFNAAGRAASVASSSSRYSSFKTLLKGFKQERTTRAVEDGGKSSWRGVSVQFLISFWKKTLRGGQKKLFVTNVDLELDTELADDDQDREAVVPKGTTLELTGFGADGMLQGQTFDGNRVRFGLDQAEEKVREEWSVGDVKHLVASDNLAFESNSAFFDLVNRKNLTKPYYSNCVICPQNARFGDLMQALEERFPDPKKEYVWLTCYGVRPTYLPIRGDPVELLEFDTIQEIFSAQTRFRRRLVFFSSLDQLAEVGDSMYFLELYGILFSQAAIEPLVPMARHDDEDRERFLKSGAKLMSNIHLFRVESATDRLIQPILEMVQKNLGGKHVFNKAVQGLLRDLATDLAKEIVQQRRNAFKVHEKVTAAELDDLYSLALLLYRTGHFMAQIGQTSLAVKYCQESLAIYCMYPSDTAEELSAQIKQDIIHLRGGRFGKRKKSKSKSVAEVEDKPKPAEEKPHHDRSVARSVASLGALGLEEHAGEEYRSESGSLPDFLDWLRLDCEGSAHIEDEEGDSDPEKEDDDRGETLGESEGGFREVATPRSSVEHRRRTTMDYESWIESDVDSAKADDS